jgi:hypothetical protein
MSNKTPLNRDCRGARTDTACNAGKGNDMTKPEFIPKLREIQSFVIPQIKQALGPLFFATSLEKKKGNVIDNGSFAYVGTHKKNLLVTCHHVWNGFLEERAKKPGLRLCACFDDRTPIPFCTLPDGTENKPIDQDKQLDIATFDMKPFEHYVRDKNCFFPNHFPQSIVNQNDAVAIIGCPGKQRIDLGHAVGWGRQPYIGFVSEISGFKIKVDFTRMMSLNREMTINPKDEKPATSGTSGCPCFVFRADYKPYLIGFVTEQHIQFRNEVQITCANCISEDGTLKSPMSFC